MNTTTRKVIRNGPRNAPSTSLSSFFMLQFRQIVRQMLCPAACEPERIWWEEARVQRQRQYRCRLHLLLHLHRFVARGGGELNPRPLTRGYEYQAPTVISSFLQKRR